MMDDMTASYSEICDNYSPNPEPAVEPDETQQRPSVLNLQSSTAKLKRLDGTVTRDGDLISYVADDLETKIKLSSPVGYADPAAWLNVSRLADSSDSKLLEDLEMEASVLAASVDSLTEHLAETLHGISALTVDSLEVYRDVVCKTCDSVDTNIKSMYQLMAKCEEMSKSMSSVYKLSAHIKNIKHLLDLLEATPS